MTTARAVDPDDVPPKAYSSPTESIGSETVVGSVSSLLKHLAKLDGTTPPGVEGALLGESEQTHDQ